MSQSERYKFHGGGEPFSGNGALVITDATTDATVRVHVKDDMWAIDVKDNVTRRDLPEPAQKAADKLGDSRTEAIYSGAVEAFWDWAQEAATERGFAKVYSAGRSGGWLAVEGTQDWEPLEVLQPTDEFRADLERFLTFAFEVVGMIDHFRNEFVNNLGSAALAPEQVPHSSEPIRVLAVLWHNDDGLNCDLYRNKPALLGALGTGYEGTVTTAITEPGKAIAFDGDEGTVVRYVTVNE
jgi:hypothetical protein